MPTDEASIVAAANAGLLVESHYFELKSIIPSGTSANRELARDLASFAIDGGALLVGLAEPKDGSPPKPEPVELGGLAERVEQIAHSIPDPPLPVTCTPIPSSDDPSRGYLLIEIPATGVAPHMVDGVYRGRGDKTKRKLSDPEVLRLHQDRARTQGLAEQLLDDYVARDPISNETSPQAHGFIIAAPVRPRPEMLLNARTDGTWTQLLNKLRDHTTDPAADRAGGYSPNLTAATEFARRADGAALTYNLNSAREPVRHRDDRPPAKDVLEFEATEEGIIRVMTTRLGVDYGEGHVVFEDMLPHLTRRTIGIAAAVADVTGYGGPWVLGVAATNIAGKPAYGERRLMRSGLGTFGTDNEEYRRYTEASTVELRQTPGAVTNRLVGRFLRSVGFDTDPNILPLLEDTTD